MAATITRQDPRYPVLSRSKNARFPMSSSESVARIELCESAEEVAGVLQRIVKAGMRPTVRSGGHCYEDFVVNNPNGAILDLGMLNTVASAPGGKGPFKIGTGAILGSAYSDLYRRYNVTIPGGSCYSVACGGHLSGGGYGLLSRLEGLSVDWITGVDILTVEANGSVVERHVSEHQDPDLFRALRGAGGANYGVITHFYFDTLPRAPQNLSIAAVSFPWETMTEEKFIHIALTYGSYWEKRGQEPDTWPLFTFLGLNHKTPNGRINISASMHDMDGKVNLDVPTEFLDLFLKCGDAEPVSDPAGTAHQHLEQQPTGRVESSQGPCVLGRHRFKTRPWIEATTGGGGGVGINGTTRGKYKSCYQKKNFSAEEVRRMYQHLTRELPGINGGAVISVDSYGGAANKASMADKTAIPQRSSVMKLQYMMFWDDPKEDAVRLKYFDELYTDVYSANVSGPHAGTPFHNDFYQGCYINYPDVDMIRYPFWPELYYGEDGLYPFLQQVKKKYDPNNIFHNSMSVRT